MTFGRHCARLVHTFIHYASPAASEPAGFSGWAETGSVSVTAAAAAADVQGMPGKHRSCIATRDRHGSIFLHPTQPTMLTQRPNPIHPSQCAGQEAQLSPSDRAMRLVSSNLANCHATVHKLLIRQVLTKLMVWSWRFSRRQCVVDNVHSTMTRSSRLPLSQVS